MSQAAAPVSTLPQQSIKAGQVFVVGRLLKARRISQNLVANLIVIPAADIYSMPGTVEVLSKNRLGEAEQDVRVLCRLTGYRRTYNSTNQETGEITPKQTADNRLYAIEE